MNDDTMAVVLACAEEDGLGPLTKERTKAAVRRWLPSPLKSTRHPNP